MSTVKIASAAPWTLTAALLGALLVTSLIACNLQRVDPVVSDEGNSGAPAAVPAIPSEALHVDLSTLLDSLSRLRGEFRSSPGGWEFEGDRRIFEAIAAHEDSAVIRLVHCLDDAEPSRATVGDKAVSVGFMCYSALTLMAYSLYHEDADEPQWPGLLEPDATPARLREAKEAWSRVIAEKRYRLSALPRKSADVLSLHIPTPRLMYWFSRNRTFQGDLRVTLSPRPASGRDTEPKGKAHGQGAAVYDR